MRILVSGASIAGPVLAYWLTRYGHEVTVVERSPVLRKTGGHAVDLFKPAMDISERMGVLDRIEALKTGTERLTFVREGTRREISGDATKIFAAASDRHVEVMRDDLSEIYYEATREDVEYVFGDSITSIEDTHVTFEVNQPRRFDLVVGADGLHSNVRQLVFGEVAKTFVGAYLAVLSVPREIGRTGEMLGHIGPGRMAAVYGARHLDDARAVFLFRSDEELDYHHRDVPRQKQLLREAFQGLHPQVDGWLEYLDDGERAFYFDSITQLQDDTWSRGRVALVGDAAYCPGPAIGGSTSLAVLGAYVLAGELACHDYPEAFANYENEMRDVVHASRAFALGAAKTLIPRTTAGVVGLVRGMQVVTALPSWVLRPLAKLNSKGVRLHDSMRVRDYERQGADTRSTP